MHGVDVAVRGQKYPDGASELGVKVRAALAAHIPHLTDEVPEEFQAHTQLGLPNSLIGPEHKPIGTFYTTEDAMQTLEAVPTLDRAGELLWQAGHPAIAEALDAEVRALAEKAARLELILYPGPFPSSGAQEEAAASAHPSAIVGQDSLSRTTAAPDDIGPPAPGEGEPEDGYPNPEVGMRC